MKTRSLSRPYPDIHPFETALPEPDSLLYAGERVSLPMDATMLHDLNLDQIISSICEGYEEHHLDEYYAHRPASCADAAFRLGIIRDMEDPALLDVMESFARELIGVKRYLKHSAEAEEDDARAKWHLDAAIRYRSCMLRLGAGLDRAAIGSQGLLRLRAWLVEHNGSDGFSRMSDAALRCAEPFEQLNMCATVDVGHDVVELSEDGSARDVCEEFATLYRRFDLRAVERESTALADVHRSSLEKRMTDIIKRDHGAAFDDMQAFYATYAAFCPDWIWRLQGEILFYLCYIRHMNRLTTRGYVFSRPRFTQGQEIAIHGGYDAALALAANHVVRNDLLMGEDERCIVLTGPNQGGKTTFARMLGQILYFASLGLPVPCQEADLPAVTGIFTHFAVEEDGTNDSGRLQEELLRLKALMDRMERGGVVILNELFSSTTTYDALDMGKRVLQSLEERGCTVLFITHLHELAATDRFVSLVTGMDLTQSQGTFAVERRPPEGRSFSHRLLDRYHLYSADIKERKHAAFTAIP